MNLTVHHNSHSDMQQRLPVLLSAVPRLTQPSTLHGTAKAFQLSNKQACVQPSKVAVNVTLLAFAADYHAAVAPLLLGGAAAHCCGLISPAHRAPSSKPAA